VSRRPRQGLGRWARKLVWVLVPLAAVGEVGHQLLEHLGQALAHHFFHILFGFGAAVVFGTYVLLDIRRNGWPTFSWRIRPPGENGGQAVPGP
jgi:hypothetical protein